MTLHVFVMFLMCLLQIYKVWVIVIKGNGTQNVSAYMWKNIGLDIVNGIIMVLIVIILWKISAVSNTRDERITL